MMPIPPVSSILETALYVAELERSVQFYRAVFGFAILARDQRFCALQVAAERQVLLLFVRGASTQPIPVGKSGGQSIPPHDGQGALHFAFSIAAKQLDPWRAWLASSGIAIESTVHWPATGGESKSTSLYFRDPDGHLIELATPGIWGLA